METLTLQENFDKLNEKYEILLQAMSEEQLKNFDHIKKTDELKDNIRSLKTDLEAERKGRDYWRAIADARRTTIENAIEALTRKTTENA
jgi:hypothetical protein